MEVQFREFNPFDLWIWLKFYTVPSRIEQQYVEELFNSWFYIGKLGGFNAENLQVQDAGIDISYLNYTLDESQTLMAPMHNMGGFEFLGVWGRCWFDLGTSDLIAIDVLLNALERLDKEFVQIETAIVGGQNEDWSVDGSDRHNYLE
ncbi:DUF3531 family protein [Myxosarcina sp. GI1]|uniref:DUF3531 family protein n=1 Tax=Myxosarcina sp. GI1 TaxID=1541065 RepID=UPI00055C1397|nr:DUF3531 family protein [Myxosarcina sp. GI1]